MMTSKLLQVLFWCFALALVTGCVNENPVGSKRNAVTSEDLLAFNQAKAVRERLFIDSLVASMHSSVMPHYEETATGLRAWSSEPFKSDGVHFQPGDTVQWCGELMLTDSTALYTWTDEEPLRFLWNQSDWPAGFHELASLLAHEQLATCIVPSHLAWGLTGYPPLVPQEAVLLLTVRQQLSFSMQVEAEPNRVRRVLWNALLDGMEQGIMPGDSDWIRSPRLAASPCMAWYEGEDGFAFGQKPKHVSLDLRTFRLTSKDDRPEDLGASSWDFDPRNDGQLLPILGDLQRLYPLKRKWACWCPADVVLDRQGREALEVTEADVLGFQWEFEAMDVLTSVQ